MIVGPRESTAWETKVKCAAPATSPNPILARQKTQVHPRNGPLAPTDMKKTQTCKKNNNNKHKKLFFSFSVGVSNSRKQNHAQHVLNAFRRADGQ
jgi:hypothetical protein